MWHKLYQADRKILAILAFLCVDIALAIIFGLTKSIDIPTFHLDGAYQTASALFRLDDNQWPGKDFFPYLGTGLTYLLYPIFKFAGGDMAASVFTSYFMVACCYAYIFWFIAAMFFPSRHVLFGVIAGSIFLAWSLWIPDNFFIFLINRFTPGNSLRPLRSFLPYIIATFVYALLKSRLRPNVLYSLIGCLAGLSIAWSNDFGIPTLSILILFALFWAHQRKVLSLKLALTIIVAAGLAASISMFITTLGHPLSLLRYNFVDVRLDQYWYFGPWRPESRILSLADVFSKLLRDFGFYGDFGWWWWLGPLILLVITLRGPTIENTLLMFVGLTLAAGGALATIGGHRDIGYQSAFHFWCQATSVIGFLFVGVHLTLRILGKLTFISHITSYVSFLLFLGLLTVLVGNYRNYLSIKNAVAADPNRFYVKELGGYLPVAWMNHVLMSRDSINLSYVEEYWGLWSTVTRRHATAPVDSVIHALGEIKGIFAARVQKQPDVVITTPRSMSPEWQPWSLSANYSFYKPLLEYYEPIMTSPTTLVWRKSIKTTWPVASCDIMPDNPASFFLPHSEPGFYEVNLRFKNTLIDPRSLLMVKNNINYAAGANGYLSLNPRLKNAEFPVALTSGSNKFDFQVISISEKRSSIVLESCSARKIVFENKEVLSLENLSATDTPYNLSDINWINGVAINFAGFFVANTEPNKSEFVPGKVVRFANGQTRKIIRQDISGPFVNILFDGEPLDGSLVGHPHKIEIIK